MLAIMNDIFKEHLSNFQSDKVISGYLETTDAYEALMCALGTNGNAFSIRNSRIRHQDDGDPRYWFSCKCTPVVPFFGSPFTIVRTTSLQCAQGPKYYKKACEKQHEDATDHGNGKKKRFLVMDTKKLGCPVTMKVRCIRFFPSISINEKTSNWRDRNKVISGLKEAVKCSPSPASVLRYYIEVEGEHTHSLDSAQLTQEIHPSLIKEIHRLVEAGFTSVRDVKMLLEQYVEKQFSGKDKPDRSNIAFYPSGGRIYNHVHRANFKLKETLINQEALSKQIQSWENASTDAKFFFRPYIQDDNGGGSNETVKTNSVLFCHQTKWQQRLLQRYGTVCLLDAAYKTIQYALPLFFLTVKTNSGYIVVGTFMVQSENCNKIAEALNVFKSWNPEWNPKYWMTDFSGSEINAIESVFESSKVYLCAFHRDQAWQKWLNISENLNTKSAKELLRLWRNIAQSPAVETYQDNLRILKNSAASLKNSKAKKYFTSQWVPEHQRWVDAFRHPDYVMCIATNNGVENQNKVLKPSYLRLSSDKTLTGMLKVVIDTYLPDSFKQYCMKNSCVKSYNANVPSFLHNRPVHFIKHVMDRLSTAQSDLDLNAISNTGDGIFEVSTTDCNIIYIVDFQVGSCTCDDFSRWRFPCKHMCAIFEYMPTWSFEKLNPEYSNNPFITLDLSHSYGPTSCDPADLNAQESPSSEICENLDERPMFPDGNEEGSEIKSIQQSIREELKKCVNLTYLNLGKQDLLDMLRGAQEIVKQAESKVERLDGLPVEAVASCGKSQAQVGGLTMSVKFQTLPPRKRKATGDGRSKGQVGKKANMWRKSSEVPIIQNCDEDVLYSEPSVIR